MKHVTLFLILVSLSLGLPAQRLTDYVDPLIGSGDHGHVFVGANVPQGMVNVGPTQLETGWDWCSGYHYDGKKIVGFAQMHLSGTGCSDLGDVALMPTLQEVELSREGLATTFSHEKELVRPGYYGVILDRGNIKAEMTATKRVALHRYTFPRGSNNARIVIDLENAVGDRLRQSRIYQVDDFTLAGYVMMDYSNTKSFNWNDKDDSWHTLSAGLDAQLVLNNRWNLVSGAEYTKSLDHYSETPGMWELTFGANYNIDATKYVGAYITKDVFHVPYYSTDGYWEVEDGFGMGVKFGVDF